MKVNQKLYTQSSNFILSAGKWSSNGGFTWMLPFCFEESSRTCNEKNATKPAQIIASLIQETEHKGKWTSFHLLPDLCPLCFSCCHVKSQTSVRSPLPTQLQPVSESVGLKPTSDTVWKSYETHVSWVSWGGGGWWWWWWWRIPVSCFRGSLQHAWVWLPEERPRQNRRHPWSTMVCCLCHHRLLLLLLLLLLLHSSSDGFWKQCMCFSGDKLHIFQESNCTGNSFQSMAVASVLTALGLALYQYALTLQQDRIKWGLNSVCLK